MLALKRRLYHLILSLHPAPFRDRFAREMSLDFDDALAAYGFPRLLADVTRSLIRQWMALPAFSAPQEHAPISSHPLLTGHYLAIDDDNLKPFEILRGTLLFAVLLFALAFALNHGGHRRFTGALPGLPANQSTAMASPAAGAFRTPYNPNHPQSRPVGVPSASGTAYVSTGIPVPGVRSGPLVVGSGTSASPAVPLSWAKILLLCAIISAIVWITSFRMRRSHSSGVRVALSALGLIAIIATALLLPTQTPPARAQVIHSDGPLPTFEVATVKPPNPKVLVILTPPSSENLVTQAGTAKTLIANAYGVRPVRVIGGPSWIDDSSKAYVIEGKIPQDLFARMQTMTGDQRHDEACLMLQSLLAARFSLKVHIESREMPVYNLTLAKSGAKLPLPNDETPPPTGASRVQQMSGGEIITKDGIRTRNLTLDGMLEPSWFDLGDRPVINKTGLAGKYNLTINWLPNIAAQRGHGSEIVAPEGQASIFTALEEQFGLKLVPTRASVDVVVIDAIQPPSEN